MVGLIERAVHVTTQWFKDEGDVVILLGEVADPTDPLFGLGGSACLQRIHGLKTGTPPRCDLTKEKSLHDALRGWIQSGSVKSAHDCSEGGLAVALAECCISQLIGRDTPRLVGAQIELRLTNKGDEKGPRSSADAPATRSDPLRLDALLFGETQSRVVISVAPHNAAKVLAQSKILEIPARKLGVVGGSTLSIKTADSGLTWDLAELHDLWWNSIPRAMR
jgi:phosphoribosylformylglycinamidine synthase